MIRRMALPLAAALAAALSATPAPAQDFPNRSIRIIVQTAARRADRPDRPHASRRSCSEAGKTAVVENRTAGAGGVRVAEAGRPGSTARWLLCCLMGNQEPTRDPAADRLRMSYDPAKDFAPVVSDGVTVPNYPDRASIGAREHARSS